MKRYQVTVILLLILVQSFFVSADLPIHCLKRQILGKWILKEGRVLAERNTAPVSCGHQTPSKEATSYKAMKGILTEISSEVEVTLQDDFVVKGKNGDGKWTLVYDEGWEIEYNNVKYTHFFKYVKNDDGQVKSSCTATLVGWYNNLKKQGRGCSQAFKVGANQDQLSDNVAQAHVVQPKEINIFSQISQTMQQLSKSQEKPALRKQQNQPSKSRFSQSIYQTPVKGNVFSELKLSKGTHLNHHEVVRRLNSITDKAWKAEIPHFLHEMTLEKMNTRAGLRKGKPVFEYERQSGSFIQKSQSTKNSNGKTDYAHFGRDDISDLPKEYSWKEYLHPPRSQEDCGSCYAIATTAMLSSRLWIKTGDDTVLSPQHSLSCNYYNQGCDGGYGFLVSKFYSEFELVPESCHPYEGQDGQCNHCNVEKLQNVYTVTDYEYIGGSYGKSTERLLMEEIKKNGPVVVSFEPKMDFMYYKSGIYHSVNANAWIENNEEKPSWLKVDHSVLCYGWGENEDGKYWLLQNSWGNQWGEEGNFRMRRGTDESNIESMGERANIQKKSRASVNQTIFTPLQSKINDNQYLGLYEKKQSTYYSYDNQLKSQYKKPY